MVDGLMDLVGNPKADRFSQGVATAMHVCMFFFLTFVNEIHVSSRFSLKYLQDLVLSILLKFLLSFYGEHAFIQSVFTF